jgi:primosomal protein N' (replication factor Y)
LETSFYEKSTDSNRAEVSIILPFADLGFVIVDEEHEQTFKQIDPAPDIMPVMQLG